jgi:hypothetical protein
MYIHIYVYASLYLHIHVVVSEYTNIYIYIYVVPRHELVLGSLLAFRSKIRVSSLNGMKKIKIESKKTMNNVADETPTRASKDSLADIAKRSLGEVLKECDWVRDTVGPQLGVQVCLYIYICLHIYALSIHIYIHICIYKYIYMVSFIICMLTLSLMPLAFLCRIRFCETLVVIFFK